MRTSRRSAPLSTRPSKRRPCPSWRVSAPSPSTTSTASIGGATGRPRTDRGGVRPRVGPSTRDASWTRKLPNREKISRRFNACANARSTDRPPEYAPRSSSTRDRSTNVDGERFGRRHASEPDEQSLRHEPETRSRARTRRRRGRPRDANARRRGITQRLIASRCPVVEGIPPRRARFARRRVARSRRLFEPSRYAQGVLP